jgi:hypothetical protein
MSRLLPLFVFCVLLSSPAPAQELDRAAEYRQSDAVLARYPDVVVALDAPALKPGRTDFTSQAEMEAYWTTSRRKIRQG